MHVDGVDGVVVSPGLHGAQLDKRIDVIMSIYTHTAVLRGAQHRYHWGAACAPQSYASFIIVPPFRREMSYSRRESLRYILDILDILDILEPQ